MASMLKEVSLNIEESAMVARDKSTLNQLYEGFLLYPKATSQLAKTVLSPVTHARNFISAGAFASANGLIPGVTVSLTDSATAFKEALKHYRYQELVWLMKDTDIF